ncbi:MAG: thioredoxin family protein [Muribaculaceae bacterium]|nr:thioredoxin family protein [Muribaculaceae bacterium]
MTYSELISQPGTLLVEFYATWCPHCQRMMPIVAQVRELLDGRAEVVQLDIDKNQEAANEAGAESIPTFIVYRNGQEKWRHSGEIDGEVLLSKVEAYL